MFSLWHRNAIDLIRFLQDRAAVVDYSYSFGIRHWPPGDSCILFFNLAPCVYTFEHFSSEDFGIWNWNEAYKILLVANQSSWLYNYSAGQNEGLLYNPLNWFKCRSFAALNWFKCRCHYILNLKTSFLMKVVCCSADWTLATTYMMNQKSNFCNFSPPPSPPFFTRPSAFLEIAFVIYVNFCLRRLDISKSCLNHFQTSTWTWAYVRSLWRRANAPNVRL